MAENPKAQTAAEPKPVDPKSVESKSVDSSAELSRLRKENADLTSKIQAYEREAEQMRAALDTARDEGRLGGLPKDAVQLAESFTLAQAGKMVDARPGDVLLPVGANLEAIRRALPTGVRAFTADKDTIAEARDRKLVRS